jgi:RNA polymerase sigma-70 factor (ECF subfamily)
MVDEGGFDEFYLVSRPRLLRQLAMMTGSADQAADALQEAYTRAWQRWRRVSRLDNPEAWVRTVAWRVAVSQHRRTIVAADKMRRLFKPADAIDQPVRSDEVLDIREALGQLSPEHRRALVLYEMCGLSVPEVAAETGVPVGTVKSRLSRARAALEAALGAGYLTAEPVVGHPAGDSAEGTVS